MNERIASNRRIVGHDQLYRSRLSNRTHTLYFDTVSSVRRRVLLASARVAPLARAPVDAPKAFWYGGVASTLVDTFGRTPRIVRGQAGRVPSK